ncbi:MAG: Ppx/GppA phosphatase family protein, partial [Cetobacterium sp.]
ENLYLFLSKTLEDRKKIIGLEPNRADVIIAGNLILLTLLDILNKNSITVSTVDNLEGGMVLNI